MAVSRDPSRIVPFLKCFEILWMKHPDLSFGQLASVVTRNSPIDTGFHGEDWEALGRITKMLTERPDTQESGRVANAARDSGVQREGSNP